MGRNRFASLGRKATECYVLLMLTLFPLFTGLSGYSFLHLKKYLLFLGLTLLWLCALAVAAAGLLLRRGARLHITLPLVCVAAFTLLGAVSTALSPDAVFFTTRIGRYDSFSTYILYGCILLGVCFCGAEPRRCLWAFSAAYGVCCGVALLQLCGLNALRLFPDDMTYYSPFVQETGAFLGTVGNVDLFSAYHCMAIPLLAAAVLLGRARRRFLLLLPLTMGCICVALARVASSFAAIGTTAVLLLPPLLLTRLRSGQGGRNGWPVRFSGVLLFAAVLAAVWLLPLRHGMAYELHSLLHGRADDSFGSHRILIWRETAAVFRSHWLFGIGPDCLGAHLDILFERDSEALGETLRATVDQAHNAYLQLMVSFGALGALPPAILMIDTWDGIRCCARRSLRLRVIFPALLCFLIQAVFNVGTCIIVPMFMILWGLALREIGAVRAAPEDKCNHCNQKEERNDAAQRTEADF